MNSGENGNGFRPIEIDVKDEHAFRTGVVQNLQLIADRTACIPTIQKKVEKHEQAYQVGKIAVVPALGVFHIFLKHLLSKLGW
jgi:hypothetical protein